MSIDRDRAERQDRRLEELEDLAMDLARHMAARAKEAEAPEESERFCRTFERLYRAVRLSTALSRRLHREAARDASQRAAEAVDLRKAQVRVRLRAEINSSGYGFSDRLEMERELDERLAEDALYQSFLALPLDQALAKHRHDLGLPEDRPVEGATEGVAVSSRLSGLQPPHPPQAGAPTEEEHLGDLKPVPS